MSKNLSFEKTIAEKLMDIPLPDEDMAWDDMKRRLDSKKDRKWFLWNFSMLGCGLFLLVSALLISGVIIIFSNTKSERNKNNIAVNDSLNNHIPVTKTTATIPGYKNTSNDTIITPVPVAAENENPSADQHLTSVNSIIGLENKPVVSTRITRADKKTKKRLGAAARTKAIIYSPDEDTDEPVSRAEEYASAVDIAVVDSIANNKETFIGNTKASVNKDSLYTTKKDTGLISKTNSNPDSVSAKTKKKKTPDKLTFATGIAMWQRLASFGAKGDASTVTPSQEVSSKALDYLPSVYARLYKGDKWFLQTEYRFRSSQKVNNLTISKKSEPTANPNTSLNTSLILTRIQYHQLPLTFNYSVTKNWYIGGGISWNRFNAATAFKRVSLYNPVFQQDSLRTFSSFTINKSNLNDSLLQGTRFSENYLQGILETQVKWKKFSLGLQYSFGLQPYIRYTLPGNEKGSSRSSLLNIFIRYEIWRNKPKQ